MEAEVDLLSYCAREWKGETPRAKLMRKVSLLIQVMDGAECMCENQEANIALCFTKPRDPLTPELPRGTIVALMIEPSSCHTLALGCHLDRARAFEDLDEDVNGAVISRNLRGALFSAPPARPMAHLHMQGRLLSLEGLGTWM